MKAPSYTLTLGSSDPGADTITSWTINWRDGTIDTVTGNPTSVTHVYADDRPAAYVIKTSATDEDGTYNGPTQSVTVQNLPPTAVSISGPSSLVSPTLGTFTLSATDPSSVDQAAKFTFHIDWDGDGVVDQNVTAVSGTQVTHAFPGNGAITVSVTATDKDGGTSATAASTVVNVTGVSAQLTSDPLNPGQQMLLVNGTSGDDNIKLTVNDNKDTVSVSVSNVLVATFTTTATFSSASRIAVYGNDGNDTITHGGGFNRAVELYGGNGNDTLNAGTNGDILVGGLGDDSLNSGLGNDLLIGGGGADKLVGGGGEDILVAGSTSFDNDPASLNAIMAEWQSSRSFTSRIANLMDNTSNPDFASRANGNVFLLADASNATVVDDTSKDTANGGDGNDWFLVNISGGTVVDKVIGGNRRRRDGYLTPLLVDVRLNRVAAEHARRLHFYDRLEKRFEPPHRVFISVQHRIRSQNLLPNRLAIGAIRSQLDRFLNVLAGILHDAIVHAHHAVLRVSDPAAQEFRRQGDDRHAQRQCFVACVAAAKMEGIERDVEDAVQAQKSVAILPGNPAHAAGDVAHRTLESLRQGVVHRLMLPFDEHEQSVVVAAQDAAEDRVKIGMKFVERLRAAIKRGALGQTKIGAGFQIGRRLRPVVIDRGQLQTAPAFRCKDFARPACRDLRWR